MNVGSVPKGWVEVSMLAFQEYLKLVTYTRQAYCGGFEYNDVQGNTFAILLADRLEDPDDGKVYMCPEIPADPTKELSDFDFLCAMVYTLRSGLQWTPYWLCLRDDIKDQLRQELAQEIRVWKARELAAWRARITGKTEDREECRRLNEEHSGSSQSS